MRYPDRVTMCVSSQAGCGMNCPFCATGQAGLTRNLSTAEIVEQVVAGARSAGARGDRGRRRAGVNNVVFMGMGEPLANYKAAIGAVRRLTEPDAGRARPVGARHHRVDGRSGAGDRQARRRGHPGHPGAVSLHAPDDELRDTLVPVNTRWKVAEVLDAACRYAEATGRRVSIEYALIRDINDQAWRADLLGKLLNARGRAGHVNLIPLNPTPGLEVDGERPEGRARVRRRRWRPGGSRPRCATPAAARSTAPAASSPPPTTDGVLVPNGCRLRRSGNTPAKQESAGTSTGRSTTLHGDGGPLRQADVAR